MALPVSGRQAGLLSNGPVMPATVVDITIGNLTALMRGLGDCAVAPGVTANAACYLAGTLILTDRGEIPVETLAVSDRLVTLSGALRPIKWIGTRNYGVTMAQAGKSSLLPVRIKRGALADNMPRRDLYISPRHALFIGDALFPAGLLVNGTSITAMESIDELHYVQIALGSDDVILAEGAPAETCAGGNSCAMVQNAQHEPDRARVLSNGARRVECGYRLEAAIQRLAARGRVLQADGNATCLGPLLGSFDQLTPSTIQGWARNPHEPECPVAITILDNGAVIAELSASDYRPDLQAAGLGAGRHGFHVAIPGQLLAFSDHLISVKRQADGAELPGSPLTLKATIAPPYRAAA